MWDKPHLLRIGATLLFGISLVLLAYSLLHYALQMPVFKLRTVQLTHTPQQVDLTVERVVGRPREAVFYRGS
jgi:hypothetical protein